ncbi:hypothetical protein FACS189472_06140 [Alphaproteobacteria bacterium]|nr:hypothetical protein FACS189472_06140 [Alphaproteobacteria bacterium]
MELDERPLHNEIFFAIARKNAAQDRSVLDVHEDPSSGSDEANCEKEPLCSSLDELFQAHNPPVFLAPMAGITDALFRRLVCSFGASAVVSEMISCEALVRNNKKTYRRASVTVRAAQAFTLAEAASTSQAHLAYHSEGSDSINTCDAITQVMGSDPQTMAESAKINESLGADVIDINMGCPARKIVSNESGSALMKNEDLAVRIAEAVVNAVKIPVTLKMRLGWDAEHINCLSLAKKFEDVGIKMLAIHCRTRNQMYSGTADWSAISQLKEIIKIPYLCNGDIKTPENAMEAIKLSGANGVMIGRAALGRPWLLRQIMDFIHEEKTTQSPTLEEQFNIVMQHFSDTLEFYGELHGIRMFRKHFCWYSNSLCGASKFRETINRSDDISFIKDCVKEFYESNFVRNRFGECDAC